MPASSWQPLSLPEADAPNADGASTDRGPAHDSAPVPSSDPSLSGAPAASQPTSTPAPLLPLDVPQAEPDDLRLWSVTTIINALDRPALMYWAAEQAAEAACDVAGSLRSRIDEEGRDAVVKWLRDARFRRPKDKRSATELGTAVHDACESYALTGERPAVDDEVLPYVIQFEKWCQQFQPSYEAAEMTVFSPTYGYAGTCDAIATVRGTRVIVDYKTSRKDRDDKGNVTSPWPETALQLAAYRFAEFAAVWRPRRTEYFRRRYYLLSEQERAEAVAVPAVDGAIAIQITPYGCRAYPVKADRETHRAFLYVLEAARWSFQDSRNMIGPQLQAVA